MVEFLTDLSERPLAGIQSPFEPIGLFLSEEGDGAEVAVVSADRPPTRTELRRLWEKRHGGRPEPILVAALHPENGSFRANLCGSYAAEPFFCDGLDVKQAERFCRAALSQPDHHAAARFLRDNLRQLDQPIPGLRNEGLFATHTLAVGVPRREDWAAAQARAESILHLRGRDLLRGLGFKETSRPGPVTVLANGAGPLALAVHLAPSESCDSASVRFDGQTPVSYAIERAGRERLRLVIVEHGAALRIYPSAGGGAGRRGVTETFVELHLDLLPTDRAAYLWLLASAQAITPSGSFDQILGASGDFAAELGGRLRDRIYDDVLPGLALALVEARRLRRPTAGDLRETYEMAMTALFRLLFVAYAEDTALLPYPRSEQYTAHSLKGVAKDLSTRPAGEVFGEETSLWDRVQQLWRAVDHGRPEWDVPEYNGGLFSEDRGVSPTGARLAGLSLADRSFGPVLRNLLLDRGPDDGTLGPIDFRSLGVREFGTIYEGLLESELSLAETDLVIDRSGNYRPAPDGAEPKVRSGEVYLHNASGVRKATGTYFTPKFAVEHLLDGALEPALDDHLARLDALDERRAGERFFDFRVADIAMGSGHFLIAAVDRIERRLGDYLARRPLPAVLDELARLRKSAQDAARDPLLEIDDRRLLRRQVARRCIYGLDLSPIAVQLARLSVWIHTFIPGLPLSFLDHNLTIGNALVGIATFDEVEDLLRDRRNPRTRGLFDHTADALIGTARGSMERLARLSDADAGQIREARQAHEDQRRAVRRTAAIFDVLTAGRLPGTESSRVTIDTLSEETDLALEAEQRQAIQDLGGLKPFHFPIAFPEVFLRDRAGFDVILGNPPWEEVTLEEDRFWIRYEPGLQGLPQRQQEEIKQRLREERPDLVELYRHEVARTDAMRGILLAGPFPGMGTGDPDLYKAFAWRFWSLVASDGGRIGVVLPRSLWAAKGSRPFRQAVLSSAESTLTFLVNNRQWVFPEVHPQYTVALSCIGRVRGERQSMALAGPYSGLRRLEASCGSTPPRFAAEEVASWTDTAALPLLPADDSANVFARLREAPRLDLNAAGQWRTRPYTELHATNDKDRMSFAESPPDGYWPVYKGESFDLWQPDNGAASYYAWADPAVMVPHLHDKRLRNRTRRTSPFSEFDDPTWFRDASTLPCHGPRLAFRDVTRATDTRTVRIALVPPRVFITNQAPFLLWPRGDERDQAFLLGVLSSIPLDWYARRFVETHVNYHVLNPFPVPRPDRSDRLWQRVVTLAGRLACPDERFAEWAAAVGVECGLTCPR